MNLTKNFTFEELTDSKDNPGLVPANRLEAEGYMTRLTKLAQNLQVLRDITNLPITVNSGFRGAALNRATPGSSATSKHSLGLAADIKVAGKTAKCLWEVIQHNRKAFPNLDRAILEDVEGRGEWVHFQITLDTSIHPTFYTTTDGKHYKKVEVV